MEDTNWLYILNIIEYTADKIENEITLLPSLLEIFSVFQIPCWYNKGHNDQNKVENIAIRCSNCEKQTGLSMKSTNANHKDIIEYSVSPCWNVMDNMNKQTFGI